MLIATLIDIHANREAMTACLTHAKDCNAQRYAFLGDPVGYGVDSAWAALPQRLWHWPTAP